MARELKGYALKASRGERPYDYSTEYNAWRRNPGEATASEWWRKHGLNKHLPRRYRPCVTGDEAPLI